MKQLKLLVNGIEVNGIIVNLIIKPLFVLFIYFGFFSRFTGLFGLSGGVLAILITFILFVLCCIHIIYSRTIRISPLVLVLGAFFVFAAVTPMISSYLLFVEPGFSFRYSIELVIAFSMFFNVYYLIRLGVLTPKFFLYTLVGIAMMSGLQLVYMVIDQASFYRLRGLGGTNYIANVFSLSACALMLIVISYFRNSKRLKSFFGIILIFVFLFVIFLIGSRQAIIAVIFGFIAINILAINSYRLLVYNLVGLSVAVGIIILIGSTLDFNFLMERFTYENLNHAVGLRLDHFSRSVVDLTIADVIVGRPDYYLEVNPTGESTVVPHNILLSLIRYNGILLLFLFILSIGSIFFEYVKLRVRHHQNTRYIITESSIFVFLMVVLIYTMLSGQITKIFTLFVVMGYAAGYIELMKISVDESEYKKMIL